MFDIDYYKKTVDEIHVNQLEKLSLEYETYFFILKNKNIDKKVINVFFENELIKDKKIYFYDDTNAYASFVYLDSNIIKLESIEKLDDCLDLEISTAEHPICILYDNESFFHCFISDFLKNEQEAFDNWELKMSEPVKFFRLTEEEIEELRKEGRI